jgi:hypothetical protein
MLLSRYFLKSAGLAAVIFCASIPAAFAQEATAEPGFWTLLFDKGGVVTWVIALLSAIGLPIAGVKLYQFYRMDIWRPKQVTEALSVYRNGEAAAPTLSALTHPAAALLAFAISQAQSGAMTPALLRGHNIYCAI